MVKSYRTIDIEFIVSTSLCRHIHDTLLFLRERFINKPGSPELIKVLCLYGMLTPTAETAQHELS